VKTVRKWRRIMDNLGSGILALALATIVWIVAVNEENPIIEDVFKEPIPIQVVNKESVPVRRHHRPGEGAHPCPAD